MNKDSMNYLPVIEELFGRSVFVRPLFYCYEPALRFELNTGGQYINMFLSAMKRSMKICSSIFQGEESILVCLYFHDMTFSEFNRLIHDLTDTGIRVPKTSDKWIEYDEFGDDLHKMHHLAFQLPAKKIENLLWCAFANEIGIEPSPGCGLYLFNIKKQIAIWPYDDRGMDVVGNDEKELSFLYTKFNDYLLDYDRERMDGFFKS